MAKNAEFLSNHITTALQRMARALKRKKVLNFYPHHTLPAGAAEGGFLEWEAELEVKGNRDLMANVRPGKIMTHRYNMVHGTHFDTSSEEPVSLDIFEGRRYPHTGNEYEYCFTVWVNPQTRKVRSNFYMNIPESIEVQFSHRTLHRQGEAVKNTYVELLEMLAHTLPHARLTRKDRHLQSRGHLLPPLIELLTEGVQQHQGELERVRTKLVPIRPKPRKAPSSKKKAPRLPRRPVR